MRLQTHENGSTVPLAQRPGYRPSRQEIQDNLEECDLNCKQNGFINAGVLTLLVAGAALVGLLIYGATSGYELPLWPAVAVILVNLVAAGKIVLDIKKKKQLQQGCAGNNQPPR